MAAVSVGIVDGEVLVDLCYEEDSAAEVDFNVVALDTGGLIEVQGTAEGAVFSRDQLNEMVNAAEQALEAIFAAQESALADAQK